MGGTAEEKSKTAAITSVAELSEEAAALMRAELHPQEYVAVLMEKTLFPDAVRFMAHAAEARSGVVGLEVRPPRVRRPTADDHRNSAERL